MSLPQYQNLRQDGGYFALFGRFEGLIIYSALSLSLVLCFLLLGEFVESASLLAPLAVGLAVMAGLSFRLAGTIASGLVSVTVFWLAYTLGWGVLPEEGAFFGAGLILLICLFSFCASLVVGYHVRTEELTSLRENMLHKVFDALPIGIWVRARDGHTVFVNQRWADFLQMTVDEILHSDSNPVPAALSDGWEDELDEVLNPEGGAMRYRPVQLTDNQGLNRNLTLLSLRLFIDHMDDFGTLSLLVDETSLRLYEDRVQRSEHSLRLALDNARMGFWDEDLITNKAVSDAAWFNMLGLEFDASADPVKLWEDSLHPDDRERVNTAYDDYYQTGGGAFRIDYRIRKSDGNYIWVQDCVYTTEFTEEGLPKRVKGTMQDISDRKQTEIDLCHAKERAESANEAKSRFIATISHEIRTPLNAIIGLSSFLAEGGLDADQLEFAQTIHSSGKSLLILVNDILDFSKIEAGHLELEVQEYPISLFFEDSVKLFKLRAEEKGVKLNLEIDPGLPEFAIGDIERLRQIVQNLLANALKFTDEGEVDIRVRQVQLSDLPASRRPDPLVPIGYLDQPDHQYIEVLVRDSGIGIPKDRQHVLFEAFSQVDSSATRKYEGTGLGLVICKRLVDAMGGCIWLESDENEGAVFGFVVRTKLVRHAVGLSGATRAPFTRSGRIAEKHPCDILVVGPKTAAATVVDVCRGLGYTPHYAESYDLSRSVYRRRYSILFISMEDEARALELTRQMCTAEQTTRPESIVGLLPEGRSFSREQCRLCGMQYIVEERPQADKIREVILNVLSAHG